MERYARKCSVTGLDMNEGYCIDNGMFYAADVISLATILREKYNLLDISEQDLKLPLTDNLQFILDQTYEEDLWCYTHWDPDQEPDVMEGT